MKNILNSDEIESNIVETNYFINFVINFFRYLINKRYFVLILFLILLISAVISIFSPNYYKAVSSFVQPPSDLLIAKNEELSFKKNIINTSSIKLRNPGDTFVKIIRSKSINANIIKKFNLIKEFGVNTIDEALEKLENITSIDSETGIIEISVVTKNPKLSAEIANEYIFQLSDLLNRMNVLNAKNQKEFLVKRMNEVSKKLSLANKKLANFQVKNKMIDIDTQAETTISSIAKLQSNIILQESQLIGLKTIYSENSSRIISSKEMLASLKSELDKIKGKLPTRNTNQEPVLLDFPLANVEYIELSRDSNLYEELLKLLSQQYELMNIKEEKKKLEIKIVDTAVSPTETFGPGRLVSSLLTAFSAFMLVLVFYLIKFRLEEVCYLYPDTHLKVNQFKDSLIKR